MKHSGPLKRQHPLRQGGKGLERSGLSKGRSRIQSRSFSEKYPADHDGEAYGPLFRELQALAKAGYCELCVLGYEGPGHTKETCWNGLRPRTAHHIDKQGHVDAKGLIMVGPEAHDLLHNDRGRRAWEHFRGWMKDNGHTPESIGLECIRKATEEME